MQNHNRHQADQASKTSSPTESRKDQVVSSQSNGEDNLVLRVMVVEDDPMLRNMLSMKFSREDDFMIMFVSDGTQAVSTIKGFEPSVLVLDLMLPGVGGFEILQTLGEGNGGKPKMPVIILSNKSDDADKQKAKELGASRYMVKAMTNLNDLVALVRELATGKINH